MSVLLIIGLAAALQTAPGSDPATATPPPAPAAVAPDDDKVVCHSRAVTGTRFATKICKTKREWAEQTRHDQDAVNDMQTRSRQMCSGNGPGGC